MKIQSKNKTIVNFGGLSTLSHLLFCIYIPANPEQQHSKKKASLFSLSGFMYLLNSNVQNLFLFFRGQSLRPQLGLAQQYYNGTESFYIWSLLLLLRCTTRPNEQLAILSTRCYSFRPNNKYSQGISWGSERRHGALCTIFNMSITLFCFGWFYSVLLRPLVMQLCFCLQPSAINWVVVWELKGNQLW